MAERKHCQELLAALEGMEQNYKSIVQGISEEHLNHSFAEHKMTIGQISVHIMSWPKYFLTYPKPWKQEKLTCRPCEYPLTPEFVDLVTDEGIGTMRKYLEEANDDILEKAESGKKGFGYLVYRLLIHIVTHTMQIGYLRHLLDPKWVPGPQFGDMATILIGMTYHSDRDPRFGGF